MSIQKPIHWLGTSLGDLVGFPENIRRMAGYQLYRLQTGRLPDDWKPIATVFADLGFDSDKANKLKLKAQLMAEISDWIREEKLRQEDAARILAVSRPRVSDIVTGKTARFTIDALVDMLERTGRQVQLQVR